MRRHHALAVASVLALVAAACSGDDAADTTTAAPTTTEAMATTTVEPEPEPEPEQEHYLEPGPYAVGVITFQITDEGDRLAEAWYPVDPDDVADAETEIFDILGVFPESLQPFIPEELSGLIETGAVRDAPIAPRNGEPQYPIVIYSHGFGGFRQATTAYAGHMASWGFVVLSTDHLERGLAAQATGNLGGEPGQDLIDVTNTLNAFAKEGISLDANFDRVGITGHSAGAGTALRAAVELPEIDVFVSISGSGEADPGKPGLVVIAERDEVATADRSEGLYDVLSPPRWLVNIAEAGHNSFTDSCAGIRELGGLQSLVGLLGEAQVARAENGCTEEFVHPDLATAVLGHYSVAFFRHFLGEGDERDRDRLGEDVTDFMDGITLADLRADP